MSLALNQLYREKATLEAYPNIKKTYDDLCEFTEKNKFYIENQDGSKRLKGRRYDDAVLFHTPGLDFNNKVVCELGARDGIFGSWLTQFVDKIYVSDYFEQWGKGTTHDLGQFEYWNNLWKSSAYDSSKMVTETQDILNLSYPDNFFDITICTSVIEHTFTQANFMGDMKAIREIVRVTKPGGYILLSTDMTKDNTEWLSGTMYYNEVDLFDRIINASRCTLVGDYDFNFDDKTNSDIHQVKHLTAASCVFALKKPE
jgi:SAM-dependent methyltransferase